MIKTYDLVFESNKEANKWKNLILWGANNYQLQEEGEPKRRKLLVLINPFGGGGGAAALWEQKGFPMLDYAHV